MITGGAAAAPTPRETPAASAEARPAVPRQFTPTESLNEAGRLAELHSLGILDTAPEAGFDDLVRLAAQITGCPIALVSLIDEQRQWFKAKVGVDVCETGRDVAFCDYVVRGRTELEVPDLRRDPRFADNPFVAGPPYAVFYAGYPIGTPGGAVLGTICVIDLVERNLTLTQREQMRALARQVSTQLELRRVTIEQAREIELRAAAQRRLARSRAEYRLLAENSGDVVARCALDGRITYLSPSVSSVLGADVALEVDTNLLTRVHPEDRSQMREAVETVRTGDSTTCTVRVLAVDNHWHWLECTLAPLYDPDRNELEIHCAARDVTERVDSAARIARSEERFRSIFHGSPMGITLTDIEGRVISANPAMGRLLGVPQEELIGRLRSEFVHPADASLHPDAMRELMRHPGESLEVQVRFRRFDGVLAWASAWLSWIDSDGEPHLLAHVFDITDRRRAELALADSETNLAAINLVTRRILSGEDARSAIVTALVDIAGANLASLLELGPAGETVITGSSDPRLVGASYRPEAVPATAAVWREEEALFIERAENHPLLNQDLARAMGIRSLLYQPIKSGPEMIALLSVSWDHVLTDLTDRRLAAVALLADEAAFALEHDALLRRYTDLAGTDPLTGLPNRRSWDERLSVLIATAQRRGEPFVVAVADVDRFKAYNDAHGHLAGDALLCEVAQAVRAELRVVDVVARWGGEEFAIALPNCRDADARQVLERVRVAMPHGQSISIGYCEWDPAQSAQSGPALMNRADSALYEAKRSGRDRVVSAG